MHGEPQTINLDVQLLIARLDAGGQQGRIHRAQAADQQPLLELEPGRPAQNGPPPAEGYPRQQAHAGAYDEGRYIGVFAGAIDIHVSSASQLLGSN